MTRRPLVGEPLALDLVNTEWVERGQMIDLLDQPDGLRAWLAEQRLSGDPASVEAPLRHTRAALRRVLDHPGEDAEQGINAILARGALRYGLRQATVHEEHDVDAGWLPAWLAVNNYLDLLRQQPTRIRRCGNPACVLHFYDISRNGTRRWCSMDGCGGRAKAARHYQRHRTPTAQADHQPDPTGTRPTAAGGAAAPAGHFAGGTAGGRNRPRATATSDRTAMPPISAEMAARTRYV